MDWKIFIPIWAIMITWFFKEINSSIESRSTKKKKIGKSLYYLLTVKMR